MGGVYLTGEAPGTVVDHNLIHDVHAFNYGAWGLYADEGTSNVSWTNNILFTLCFTIIFC